MSNNNYTIGFKNIAFYNNISTDNMYQAAHDGSHRVMKVIAEKKAKNKRMTDNQKRYNVKDMRKEHKENLSMDEQLNAVYYLSLSVNKKFV